MPEEAAYVQDTVIEPVVALRHELAIDTPHKRPIRRLLPSSDGKLLFSASSDGVLCTWNASSLALVSRDSVISKFSHRMVGKEEALTDFGWMPYSNRCALLC